MTRASYPRIALHHFGQYWAAVLSAAFLCMGIMFVIDPMKLAIAGLVIRLINYLLLRAFRDVVLLSPGMGPEIFLDRFSVHEIAQGTILVVLGILLGLWVNSRKPPQRSA